MDVLGDRMRQEPQLTDFDALDEPRAPRAPGPSVVINRSSAGPFLWLLVLLNLGGLAALGYFSLNFQGQAIEQGSAAETTDARLATALDDAQADLTQLARALKNQGIVDDELANRLDLVTGQGVSANAAEVKRLQSTLREQETQLNAVTARLDALLTDLGQNKDQSQTLNTQVSQLTGSLRAVETQLGGLDARLGGQDELIESIAGRFGSLTASVTAQSDELSALQTAIVRLEGSSGSTLDEVESQQAQLARLDGRVSELAVLAAQKSALQPDPRQDIALLQDQITVQRRELTEISERLRSIDQFRIQTGRLTQRLEAGLREVQAQ